MKHEEEVKAKDQVLRKQECIVSDHSKACWFCGRLVLWENLDNGVKSEKCYNIINISVKAYAGQTYLSTLTDSEIAEIQDIGEKCSGM